MYSHCYINFIQHDCFWICHGTDCFMYIIYLDSELYRVVQLGNYIVLYTDSITCYREFFF